jgi:hypothetical protein
MMDLLRIKVGQTGDISSTNIFTILPETSDSISLNNFMASTQERHLSNVVLPQQT